MEILLSVILGYLLGSLNPAALIGKFKQTNLKKSGTGNLGATNVLLHFGKAYAVVVMLFDIFKAVAAFHLAALLFPSVELASYLAGAAAVVGHIFPFYLKFKGGKGFASYLGMTLALNWKFALIVMAAVVLITLVTDYLVLGTFTTIAAVPVYFGVTCQSWLVAAILLVGTAAIFLRHLENIPRLIHGTEVGLRSTARGEHRVKKEK